MASLPANPWYREPWPWILMAAPAAAVLAGTVTAVIAFSGADGLVADDYYKQGVTINRTIARDAAARSLGVTAELAFDAEGVVARFDARAPLPERIRLTLAHATRAGRDQVVFLARDARGVYRAPLAVPGPGRWSVIAEAADWRLAGALESGAERRLVLGAASD